MERTGLVRTVLVVTQPDTNASTFRRKLRNQIKFSYGYNQSRWLRV